MNIYMKAQVVNITAMVRSFVKSCEMASKKDDGVISREEQKQLERIRKASERFIRELETLK